MADKQTENTKDLKALTVNKKELVMVFDTTGDTKITMRLRDPRADLNRDDVEPVMQMAIDNQLLVTSAGDAVTGINSAYLQQVETDKYI